MDRIATENHGLTHVGKLGIGNPTDHTSGLLAMHHQMGTILGCDRVIWVAANVNVTSEQSHLASHWEFLVAIGLDGGIVPVDQRVGELDN